MSTVRKPHRDDDVAVWLKRRRDYYDYGSPEWRTLDETLDDYRLHADVGQPLFVEVHEGGVEFE